MSVHAININMSDQKRLGFSFVASLVVHLLLLIFIAAKHETPPKPHKKQSNIMDVTLIDQKKKPAKKAPKDARTMANQNAIGSSRNAHDKTTRMARAPQSGKPHRRQPLAPQQPKAPPPPTRKRQTRTLARRGEQLRNRPSHRQPKPKHHSRSPAPLPQLPLSNLIPSTNQLAQMSRNFERERRMRQKMNREADIPINTRQAKYAPYAQALVRALEEQWRPGEAQYDRFPEEARRSLIKLTIERDGSLGGIQILRPSPIPEINESARRAIHDAAPFKVLPSSWGLDRVSFYLTFEVVNDRFVFRPAR